MSAGLGEWAADRARLIRLAARMIGGRLYWILPLLPLVWIAWQVFRLKVGMRPENFTSADAQGVLIAFPMTPSVTASWHPWPVGRNPSLGISVTTEST